MSIVNWDKVGAVVMGAGRGSRLNSTEVPKVMLPIAGKPIVSYTIETLKSLGLSSQQICIVVGFKQEKVREYFKGQASFAEQTKLLGTAQAAYTGMQVLPKEVEHVLVMGGDDSAFYKMDTLKDLVVKHINTGAVATLLSAEVDNPSQLGRIVRHQSGEIEIIEKEYLTTEQMLVKEISTGTFVFNRKWYQEIFPTMPKLRKLNEYGLPTALAVARGQSKPYQVVKLANSNEWFGVNTPAELEEANNKKIKSKN